MSNGDISSFLSKIKSDKKTQIFLIAILLAVMLVTVFVFPSKSDSVGVSENDAVSAYVKQLEDKLSKTLSEVENVGSVSVIITVESGMETVLAMKTTVTETESGKETIETPVMVNGKTVVLKENYPKIAGVLIVAQGAKEFAVLTRIQQATTSLLDINLNQIEILTKK